MTDAEEKPRYKTRVMRAEQPSVAVEQRWRVKHGHTLRVGDTRYRPGEMYAGPITPELKDKLEEVNDG